MGVLPVPDEIRQMTGGITELARTVKAQNSLLEKTHAQIAISQSAAEQVKFLLGKLDACAWHTLDSYRFTQADIGCERKGSLNTHQGLVA